jgi:hypothetical protein
MNQRDYNAWFDRELSRLDRFSREPSDSDPADPGDDLPRDGGEQNYDKGASD